MTEFQVLIGFAGQEAQMSGSDQRSRSRAGSQVHRFSHPGGLVTIWSNSAEDKSGKPHQHARTRRSGHRSFASVIQCSWRRLFLPLRCPALVLVFAALHPFMCYVENGSLFAMIRCVCEVCQGVAVI
eukprot:6190772-Pleurochrysis_carterae.AAC.2